jgi:peptidoglycan/LPS O-acetylase OafA/YrhL
LERSRHLDILRGLAILLVFLHHLPEPAHHYIDVPFGGRGVDLFFALSGFLVGTTALARQQPGMTPFRAFTEFAVLRTARTWPLYFAVLAVIAVGGRFVDPVASVNLRNDPDTYLFFLSNYRPQASLSLGVLWSLAVEEHFYLLIGLVILVAGVDRLALRKAFIAAALILVLLPLIYRTEMIAYRDWGALDASIVVTRVFFATLSRIDAMGYGLLIAAAFSPMERPKLSLAPLLDRLVIWSVVLVLVLGMHVIPNGTVFGFSAVSLLSVSAIALAVRLPYGALPVVPRYSLGLFEVALANAGTLSYGLYLFHPLTRYILRSWGVESLLTSHRGAWTFFAIWLAFTWLLSFVSYRLFERKVLDSARAQLREARAKAHSLATREQDPLSTKQW